MLNLAPAHQRERFEGKDGHRYIHAVSQHTLYVEDKKTGSYYYEDHKNVMIETQCLLDFFSYEVLLYQVRYSLLHATDLMPKWRVHVKGHLTDSLQLPLHSSWHSTDVKSTSILNTANDTFEKVVPCGEFSFLSIILNTPNSPSKACDKLDTSIAFTSPAWNSTR